MRIAMMGSGGIGGVVGARLAEAGEDVAFIARGAHLEAMQRDGLKVTSPLGDVHLERVTAVEEPAEIGPVDLVIFAVKMWDTETAAARLAPLIAPHTRVVTFQNGIDSVEALRRYVPGDHVVGGVIYIGAAITAPARSAAQAAADARSSTAWVMTRSWRHLQPSAKRRSASTSSSPTISMRLSGRSSCASLRSRRRRR